MTLIKTRTDLSMMIDHTLLKAEASQNEIEILCKEAADHSFFSVCVNPIYVPLAVSLLKGTKVKVATVCGFPLGTSTTETKRYEAHGAVSSGASEVDMVLPIGALKEGQASVVFQDIRAVKNSCPEALLKVILEVSLLTDDEIIKGCEIAKEAGADFVKTSTGFSSSGASLKAVQLMRRTVGKELGVKASGGIRTLEQAQAMIDAGASRLGTSSGVSLLNELRKRLANS